MSYAGDVESHQALHAIETDAAAVLVDVRTETEWRSVGVPDTPGVVFVELIRSDGTPNRRFLDELGENGVSADRTVYFLCRSGQRSRQAARMATSVGYRLAYNVCDGFEGPADHAGRRIVSGWKNKALPWRELK